jgi:hypothetical protein
MKACVFLVATTMSIAAMAQSQQPTRCTGSYDGKTLDAGVTMQGLSGTVVLQNGVSAVLSFASSCTEFCILNRSLEVQVDGNTVRATSSISYLKKPGSSLKYPEISAKINGKQLEMHCE